jgi:electron transfer flavoprotein alpha subunit
VSRVVCFVEVDVESDEVVDASLRALTFARALCGGETTVAGLVERRPSPSVVGQLERFGVGEVRYLDVEGVSGYAPLVITAALETLLTDGDVAAVVAAATDHGNEVLAHLGARTGLAFVANCTEAHREDGGFGVVRQRWGGSLIEDAVLGAQTALFSVSSDGVAASPAPGATTPQVAAIQPSLGAEDLALQAAESRSGSGGVSLASAKVVVSGGRGIGSAEGFAVVEELAALLGGAVGVSRAVTSAGWRPHREQVGQTGTKVTPDLYLAFGISGAIQHLAGCQAAKHMVAVNTDPDAPIMARADYAVIGDASEILPALVAAVRARRGGG